MASDTSSAPTAEPTAKAIDDAHDPRATSEMMAELRDMVERGRRRWRRLIIMEALSLVIALPLAYLWLVFWIDNWLHLPVWGRVIASATFFVVCGYLFYRLKASWERSKVTEDQVALAIERRTPGGLENRLINSLQLTRDGRPESAAVSSAVVAENYRILKRAQMQQSAESRPAVVRMCVAVVVVLVGLGFWGLGNQYFTNAATRIFMPFADIEPVYQTVLVVEPGDITVAPGSDVELAIRIDGKVPEELVVLTESGSEQMTRRIDVRGEQRRITHKINGVQQSLAYAVRGNDYVTRYYQIRVPTKLELERLSGVLNAPKYTNLPPRPIESVSGDLEALIDTKAELTFTFNQPLESASMLLETLRDSRSSPEQAELDASVPGGGEVSASSRGGMPVLVRRVKLEQAGPRSFKGAIVFRDVVGYKLESKAKGESNAKATRRFELRITPDNPPQLRLGGVEPDAKVMIDDVLGLRVSGKDDYGLKRLGLFYRPVLAASTAAQKAAAADRPSSNFRSDAASAEVSETTATGDGPAAGGSADAERWKELRVWNVEDQRVEFSTTYDLPVSLLEAVEGQKIELAVRGMDTDPSKSGWLTGETVPVLISGVGVDLQLTYEQILRSESQLKNVAQSQEASTEPLTQWMEKLSPLSGMRWDDQANLDTLDAAMKAQAKQQSQLRDLASSIAREMVPESGSLKMSVGMLADTEMVRSIRILESVIKRENPQQMRATLADARLTQQRVVRSLGDIRTAYQAFREDWELGHMLSFTKMLMERQTAMAAASTTYADLSEEIVGESQRKAAARRQLKLMELSGLAQTAFAGMAKREDVVGPLMAEAFGKASEQFGQSVLRESMNSAATALENAQWAQAHAAQNQAAAHLEAMYDSLRQAQTDAAAQALANLQKLAEGDPLLEQELAKLKANLGMGVTEIGADEDIMGQLSEMQRLAEWMKKKHESVDEDKTFDDYKWDDSMKGLLAGGRPKGTDFSMMTLAEKPGGQKSFPDSSDLEGNAMETKLLGGEYEDVVGDLLEEADQLRDQYETYNLNAQGQDIEPGDVGKQAGDLNSMSAAAATGNQKPPSNNFGGASRAGRQGARSYGMMVGDETINRRGRDEAQEGQDEAPDVAGELTEKMSDDPMTNSSTGVGGKVVKDDQTHFSTKDAGEWKDEYTDRLRDPQEKQQIVERAGKRLDPRVAEMMRDLESDQEQVIERIKAVKKDLDSLYLPTDHLDDIMEQLTANLERLKDKPDAEVFRQQVELLDQLKGAVVVFGRASSEYEQSLQREQVIRGRILDEAAYQALPGYEDAVARYYEKLSGQ